jgi:hypothetical protein
MLNVSNIRKYKGRNKRSQGMYKISVELKKVKKNITYQPSGSRCLERTIK